MTVLAWHFVGNRLRDGRPVPPDGEWLVHDGPVVICESGLHASRDPFDALQYAPGPVLCRVECDGEVAEQRDKLVCRRRRIIARADITETLRYYARMQALSVIDQWPKCPPDVVLDYLMTGDESIRDAAWDAAWAAASAATRAAACAAACAAAWAAARGATRAAASAATRAAACAAAWATSRDAARDDFRVLVHEQFGIKGDAK